jgi:hypothetical protein
MDKDYIRDQIEEFYRLRHRAEMKHINCDRMGDKRDSAYAAEEEADNFLDKLVKELHKEMKK